MIKYTGDFEQLRQIGFKEHDNRFEMMDKNPLAKVLIQVSKENYKNGYAKEREVKLISAWFTSQNEISYIRKFLKENNLDFIENGGA